MRQDLLRWQWQLYPEAHRRRTTLAIHVVTSPIFVMGSLMLGVTPIFGWHFAVAGALFMATTVLAQGWAHGQEDAKPVPFDGPLDFVARFFAEQFVTFPRFVFTGAFARAWRRNA